MEATNQRATLNMLFHHLKAYQDAISDVQPDGTIKRHHEIYLGDPRKIETSKMKTVLRHPIKI